VAEVALAVVLAVAAGLVLRSFARVSAVAPGFDPTQVTAADFDLSGPAYSSAAAQNQFTRQVLDRLAATPQVQAAGVVSVLPLDPDHYDTRAYFTQDPPITTAAAVGAANAVYDTYFVSPGYFAAMGIPLRRGRRFTEDDMQHPTAAIIVDDALAAKLWPGRNPIGQAMALAGTTSGINQQWASVVGVVANVHQYSLDRAATPEVYVPYTLNPGAASTLVVRTAASAAAVRAGIEQAVWGVDGEIPIANLRLLSELVSGSVAQRRLTLELIGLFGALALGLAALGIYGVVAYTTAQRTSEIGMRMALGASRGEIVGLVIGGGLRPAGLGLVVGALVALAAGRALQQLTFGISPSDPATLGVVLAVLALVAAAACAIPAWRASRLDPAACLREGS
ncbi:MAG: FtsX-like permease family protein, partial [Terriglobales bacterium]